MKKKEAKIFWCNTMTFISVSAAVSAVIMAPSRLRAAFNLQTCYIAFILVLTVCWLKTWFVCEGVFPYWPIVCSASLYWHFYFGMDGKIIPQHIIYLLAITSFFYFQLSSVGEYLITWFTLPYWSCFRCEMLCQTYDCCNTSRFDYLR